MSKLETTKAAGSALTDSANAPNQLDWQRFRTAHFPGSRRHDLEAIAAYGAYRRLPTGARATNGLAGATALQGWEDEGGAV
jgi:hypothetical protein